MPVVLVVEDDVDIALLVTLVLEDEHCTVLSASDGESALELAARERLDLILLDARLPGMSGEAVAQRLRASRDAPPVVMFSASADLASIAERVGAAGFIRKPFDVDELAETVRHALAAPAAGRRSAD